MWLSSVAVRRNARFAGARLADFGCGFDATFVRTELEAVRSAFLVDLALADDLKAHPKVTAIEGRIPDVLPTVESSSLDVTLCLSVLEHLWDPERALRELRRVTAPGGVALLNVPSWRGKRALELSAFRLGLSPAEEMDDHKWYFDPRDLWPMLVRAGFKPQRDPLPPPQVRPQHVRRVPGPRIGRQEQPVTEFTERATSRETVEILQAVDVDAVERGGRRARGGPRRAAAGCSSSASAARPATRRTRSTTSARSAASRPTPRPTTSPS